ncbi:probable flavin-containing monooxygenase 1 isoform X5 [Arachis hypogaea]|uniref:probable flavin-containing monooxygenase 1 isoform X5 n=1 Tax=Arachis hypogaea TaxID=3818 RepID=UPI000DED2943|nr:probable flavin-containing monooxygenase 1 isoform X2 [Arachis hypogaea]
MERRVAIIGAGTSGLLACKYTLEKGFNPVVFEAEEGVGGLWRQTTESTKLQNKKLTYQFSDFPWHSSVKEENPSSQQVLHYLNSFAQNFSLFSYIRFNSKVIDVEYVGESSEEMETWELWGGNGKPFSSKGTWHITVQHTKNFSRKVYEAEFVILCIGKYSGVPNIPLFPPGQGPEVFKGVKYPCTMIQRSAHWFFPELNILGIDIEYFYANRFAELLVHKPGESFLLSLVATLLSPLRWGLAKVAESYLRWRLPMKKYGLVPSYSILQGISSCRIGVLAENFYDKLKEGSILIKKSQSFGFCKEGLLINGEAKPLETDIVILATGYKGDEKLQSIFKSHVFQKYIIGSKSSSVPLYRQIIHPRIPQLAIIGYAESLSNLYSSEMRCQWLAHFLDGNIELPTITEMEKDVKVWDDNMKLHAGEYYWKSCIANCGIWYNDQLCKDIGCNHRRKKGLFAELFEPYGPKDYVGLSHKR